MGSPGHKVSVLESQFNDLCFGFNSLLEELRKMTLDQEDLKMKLCDADDEVAHLKSQLQDVKQANAKLESKWQHTSVLLKSEIQARTKLQEEKKILEGKLKAARDIVVSAEHDNEDIRARLEMPSSSSHRRSTPQPFGYGRDWIKSAKETNSPTGSSVTSVDLRREHQQAEEELELSTVRSSRAASRTKRTSEEIFFTTDETSKRRSRHENSMDMSGHKRVIATTTVTIPKGGPITTTSTIESHPESNDEEITSSMTPSRSRKVRIDPSNPEIAPSAPPQYLLSPNKSPGRRSLFGGRRSASVPPPPTRLSVESGYLRSIASGSRLNQRRHQFSQKTIIKSETCLPCGNRIKFGKPALKCVECRETCHVDCKSSMPSCVPTKVASSGGKHFVGTLADFAPNTTPMIPGIVVHCVNEIERRGLSEVGLYRLNGSEKEIQDMKDRLLQGRTQLNHLAVVDIHVVTGTLKLFLRSLREPIITFTLWHSFVRLAELCEETDAENLVYSLVPDLPQPNRDTLAFVMLHLQRVASSRECKMPISNLARIFGPVIIGNSCRDPDPESCLKETKKQHFTMERLLQIPNDYWSRFIIEH